MTLLENFEMVPVPTAGRRYRRCDRVRLGDVTRGGQLRLDALIRSTQLISNDDTNDAGLEDDLAWIARSTVVDVIHPAGLNESISLTTFCGGLGRTWAERRIQVVGDSGAHYEVATLWVSIDPGSMRPRRLSEQFLELYGPAAQGRRVSARQRISRPSAVVVATGDRLDWTPRWGDIDPFGHVNNVIYWSALQHALAADVPPGHRLSVEHGAGVLPEDRPVVVVDRRRSGGLNLWWLTERAGELSDAYSAAAAVVPGAAVTIS